MIPIDEFYSKPRPEQQELVDEGHLVVDGEVATTIPSPNESGDVYVFNEPVTDLIVDKLKGAQYTANELEPEFPIGNEEIDELFRWMKYQPMDLLANHSGVLRVKDTEGAAYVYTIETIPFLTRCIDPTLGGYLLTANDRFPFSIPDIKTGRDIGAREEYFDEVMDYWGLPEDELTDHVGGSGFAKSTLGPVPVAESLPDVERVVDRFRSVGESYERKQHDVSRVKHGISFHKSQCRRNPSLPAFQAFSLYLFDVNEHATVENDGKIHELVEQGAHIFYRCLYGDLWPGAPTTWHPFRVDVLGDLESHQSHVVDILEQQPTSNGKLADRWEFESNEAVWNYLQSDLNQYVTRNSDQFACATESARRFVQRLAQEGLIEYCKSPPRVPPKKRITVGV